MKSQLIINHLSFIIGKSKGFTLIELMVVVTIVVTLLGFITINLVNSQQKATLNGAAEILITELKQQQLKSMIGDTEGRSNADSYGVHFESNRYILFHGDTYSENSSNIVNNLSNSMQFNNVGLDVIFSKLNGEITVPITIELQDNTNSSIKRIYINSIGVVTRVD